MPNTVDEAEARCRARRLGREERLEDVLERLGIDAFAGVRHRQHDVLRLAPTSSSAACADIEPSRLIEEQRQPAAGRHRVARVDHQVHDDLLELSRIDQHQLRRLGVIERERTSSPISRSIIGCISLDGGDQIDRPAARAPAGG